MAHYFKWEELKFGITTTPCPSQLFWGRGWGGGARDGSTQRKAPVVSWKEQNSNTKPPDSSERPLQSASPITPTRWLSSSSDAFMGFGYKMEAQFEFAFL